MIPVINASSRRVLNVPQTLRTRDSSSRLDFWLRHERRGQRQSGSPCPLLDFSEQRLLDSSWATRFDCVRCTRERFADLLRDFPLP